MTRTDQAPFTRLGSRDGWRTFRNLLGGTLILAAWLALWAWVAAGVVRPLSALPGPPAGRPAATDRA